MRMKKLLYILMGLALLLPAFSSCGEDDLKGALDKSRLNFEYEDGRLVDSIVRYSFAFGPDETMIDTVWLQVNTMGVPVDYDRPLALQQLATGEDDAVSGLHYVNFDDPELVAKYYYIPAGAITTQIPVVVKRDDPTLKTVAYTLRVGFKPNEEFDYGSKEFSFKRIVIADKLVEPENYKNLSYFFGEYGPVRHRFLIDASGEKWDDKYVDYLYTTYMLGGGDQNYLFYYAQKMHRALQEYNRTHDKPLCEEGGVEITFDFGAGFE